MRILLVRTSAIGDVLMASPVAKVLKDSYPAAYIAWLVEPLAAPLVHNNPFVDEVIIVDSSRMLGLLRQGHWRQVYHDFVTLRHVLHENKFDIAIDLQGLYKSGILTWLSLAPLRIGASNAREWTRPLLTKTIPIPEDGKYLSYGYLAFLSALGIPPAPQRLVLEIPQEDREKIASFLRKNGLHKGNYLACCITSSRAWKEWEWTRWSALATRAWHEEGLMTVLIGGPERQQQVDTLAKTIGTCCVSAAGRTSLLQSAALVQSAAVVVGCDTGLTYAGLAVQTPTVALYGPTDPQWLYNEPHVLVCHHPRVCMPCRIRAACKSHACMEAITVDEVMLALRSLLAKNAEKARLAC